jgi:hypothetical protein
MTLAQLRRLSGWALVLGGLAALIGNVATGVLFPDNFNPTYAGNPLFVPLNLLALLGTLLLVLGLPGLYAARRVELAVAGFVGIVLIAVTAMLFGVFFGLFALIVEPFLSAQAPQLLSGDPPASLLVFLVVSTIIQVVGSILFALPMLRGALQPRWAGYVLVISAVLAVVSFLANGPASGSGALAVVLNVASPVLLLVVLAWLGYQLLAAPALAASASDADLARAPDAA